MKQVDVTTEEWQRLNDAKQDKAWERYYDAGHYDHTAIRDRYDVTLALVRGPRVLDVGCGQGLLAHLAERDITLHVVGVDASVAVVIEARRNGVDAHLGQAEDVHFSDGLFDTVVLGQVLEHVQDAGKAASEALRVLKAGGRLIVNVPADDAEPHGNHLRAFESVDDMLGLFGEAVTWQGQGRVHHFWYAWGEKR